MFEPRILDAVAFAFGLCEWACTLRYNSTHPLLGASTSDASSFGCGRWQGCGVVQMEDVESAREALAVLNGSRLQNTVIIVQPDARATPEDLGAQARGKQPAKREQKAVKTDPTRLFVSNLAASVTWADLKQHFSHIGAVPYCDVYMYRRGSKEVRANPEIQGTSKVCACVCVCVVVAAFSPGPRRRNFVERSQRMAARSRGHQRSFDIHSPHPARDTQHAP